MFCLWDWGWQEGVETKDKMRQISQQTLPQSGQDGGPSDSKVDGRVLIPLRDGTFPLCLRMLVYSVVYYISDELSLGFVFGDISALISLRWNSSTDL